MKNKSTYLMLLSVVISISLVSYAKAQSAVKPQVSIMEIMESIITPITNTLWAAQDPKTEEEWKELEDAAIAVIAAGSLINLGGTGQNDNEWIKEPAWQAYSKIMTNAGMDALKAIRSKDIGKLVETGEPLYISCEECHLKFNPGVINQ